MPQKKVLEKDYKCFKMFSESIQHQNSIRHSIWIILAVTLLWEQAVTDIHTSSWPYCMFLEVQGFLPMECHSPASSPLTASPKSFETPASEGEGNHSQEQNLKFQDAVTAYVEN